MLSRFIPVSVVWIYNILFMNFSTEGYLSFSFLAIMENAAVNIHQQVFCGHISYMVYIPGAP